MDVKIYVGDLAKSTTEDELKTLFTQAGPVALVEVIKDRVAANRRALPLLQ